MKLKGWFHFALNHQVKVLVEWIEEDTVIYVITYKHLNSNC